MILSALVRVIIAVKKQSPTPSPTNGIVCPDLNNLNDCQDALSGGANYLFQTCPDYIYASDYPRIQTVMATNSSVKLCPDTCTMYKVAGAGYETCFGWAGTSECSSNLVLFVNSYLDEHGTAGLAAALKSCPVVAATMMHESNFGTNARSWDLTCSNTGGVHGAFGMFQYDFKSGINPVPVSMAR